MSQHDEPSTENVREAGPIAGLAARSAEERNQILQAHRDAVYTDAGYVPERDVTPLKPGLALPVKLPSEGNYYSTAEEDSLIPGGVVRILPMRGEQEEKIAVSGETVDNSLLFQVIAECVEFEARNFDYKVLLVEDWMDLFLRVLEYTYERPFRVKVQCPHCGKFTESEVPISAIERTSLRDTKCWSAAKDEVIREPFVVEALPRSGDRVTFRKQRVGDLMDVMEHETRERAKGNKATQNYQLALHIVRINDKVVSRGEARKWVANAQGKDLSTLRAEIDAHTFGPEMRPEFRCNHCRYEFRRMIPLDISSFREGD